MMRTLAALGAVAAATVIAARTGVLAKLGRRTTVRVVHPVR
jgi:hypothetical protein